MHDDLIPSPPSRSTGEVSGSYYMFAQNQTFYQALTYDDSLETRNIEKASSNGLQWYCYHLLYTRDPWRTCKNESSLAAADTQRVWRRGV